MTAVPFYLYNLDMQYYLFTSAFYLIPNFHLA